MIRHYFAILSLVGAAALAQGCAPLVVAGAGTAAVAAHDRRSVGAFIDDSSIELQVRTAIDADEAMKRDTHINATSVNGIVLLSGEAASSELRDRVVAKVREIGSIRRIVNEIRIASPSSIGSRTHDTWITTKVKAKLIGTEHLDSTRIKVVTEHDAVYLMGIVSRNEAKLATDTATTVDGVTRVVKLFEYLD